MGKCSKPGLKDIERGFWRGRISGNMPMLQIPFQHKSAYQISFKMDYVKVFKKDMDVGSFCDNNNSFFGYFDNQSHINNRPKK